MPEKEKVQQGRKHTVRTSRPEFLDYPSVPWCICPLNWFASIWALRSRLPRNCWPTSSLARTRAAANWKWSARGRLVTFTLQDRDESFTLRLLAGEFAHSSDRFGFLPNPPFRGLFKKSAPPHLAEHTLALHFLFQDPKSLFNIVVTDKDLQCSHPSVESH